MRNHNEKSHDIARSVLPVFGPQGCPRRTSPHPPVRNALGFAAELHTLGRLDDPDDFEGDLRWEARSDMAMVRRRRDADKIGPLLAWAARTNQRDPGAHDATPQRPRGLLPVGASSPSTIGETTRSATCGG